MFWSPKDSFWENEGSLIGTFEPLVRHLVMFGFGAQMKLASLPNVYDGRRISQPQFERNPCHFGVTPN